MHFKWGIWICYNVCPAHGRTTAAHLRIPLLRLILVPLLLFRQAAACLSLPVSTPHSRFLLPAFLLLLTAQRWMAISAPRSSLPPGSLKFKVFTETVSRFFLYRIKFFKSSPSSPWIRQSAENLLPVRRSSSHLEIVPRWRDRFWPPNRCDHWPSDWQTDR